MNISRALLLGGALLLAGGSVQAQSLTLKNDYPTHYTVRKGDTLWDISAHFLKSPWLWPRLWRANPQVDNPHLIYPGDRLTLIWVNGEPRLVRDGEASSTVVTLSPQVRAEAAVSTIPLASIMNYTSSHQLLSPREFDAAPVLLGDRHGRDLLRKHELAYVGGRLVPGQLYGVYRDMGDLVDERTGRHYGRRGMLVGTVTAREQLEPSLASVHIDSLSREMRPKDVLLPLSSDRALAAFYQPSPGPAVSGGQVMAMGHQGEVAARHDVVLLNKGRRHGLHSGHLYGAYRPAPEMTEARITLPALPVARVMVFQVYEEVSAALVLDSREPVQSDYLLGRPVYDERGL